MRPKLSPRFWLFAILLAAFALRLYRLGVASLWYDETVSVYLAQQDLVELTRHTAGDIHPPLYYYLLHLWARLAGWSEFSAAFFSLFFGILLIALVYRVAHDWFSARVALLAAFLVTLSPFNLWYAQEVRMYTLGATLGLASVYFFVRVFGQRSTGNSQQSTVNSRQSILSRDLIAYAVVSALGLYMLYYFAFLIVFENLFALIWLVRNSQHLHRTQVQVFAIRNLELRIWFFSQLAILVLYAPWVPIAFRQATDPPVPPWRSFTPLPNVLLESFSALALGQSVDPMFALPVLVVVALVVVTAFVPGRRPPTADRIRNMHHASRIPYLASRITNPLFLLAYTLIPLLIIYVLSLWKPLYHVRYVFIYSPAFYILLALGINQISNLQSRISRFLLLAFSFLLLTWSAFSAYNFWFSPQYAKDDLRGAVNYISEHWRPGDAVLINAGYTYTAFTYYSAEPVAWRGRLIDYMPRRASDGAIVLQTGSIGGAPNLGWGDPRSDFYATTADETRAALDRVFAAHPRVWLLRLYDTVVDPDGVIREYLAQRGRIIADEGFAGESYGRVQGYLTTRPSSTGLPTTATRRDVLLGNRIMLLGFEPASLSVRAGASIDVNLYWQAQEPTNVDNRLFVGLYADDGTLVASTDELPIGNALGTSRWTPGEILREPVRLRVPQDLPGGIYSLRVTMYNPLTNEPFEAKPSEWVVERSQIGLTTVRVEK